MKIIEAMKSLKHLQEKCADLREKVGKHSADLDFETPVYEDQKAQVQEWVQSHADTIQEIARLRTAIQRTNLATAVTIELGGKRASKTIAEWIHRRRDLAKLDFDMQSKLWDGNRKEGNMSTSSGGTKEVKIRRYYDPRSRDEKMELYRGEPSKIDGTLEVVNAVTDLLD